MEDSNKNKVYKGMKSQTIVTIVMGILEVIYFAIMSRLLNKEDFGYFAVITAVTAILQTLTEAGLGSSVIQKKDPSAKFISTAFTLSILTGVFFCIFLIVGAGFFSNLMLGTNYLKSAFMLMSIPLFLSNINSIARAMMMRKLDFLKFGIYQTIAYIISSAIGIVMAYNGYGFYAIITVAITNQLCTTIILYGINKFSPGLCLNKNMAKEIFSYGGWLTGAAIVRSIIEQLDKLILSRWLSVSMLGAFNRPSGFLSQITTKINGIFDTILFPILSGIQDDEEKIKSAYIKATTLVVTCSLILTYLFILGSKLCIEIFFGSSWLNLVGILQILSISVVFLGYGRIADCFMRSLGIVKTYFCNRFIACIITVICLYYGCKFGGMTGAAIGLTLSRIFDVVIKIILLKNRIKINRFQFYSEIFKSNIIPFIAFLFSFYLISYITYGSIISCIIFCVIVISTVVFFPNLYGIIFANNIIKPIKSKLNIK